MKILFFVSSSLPRQGGVEYKTHYLANALSENGVDVVYFSPYRKDPNRIMDKFPRKYRETFYWLPPTRGLFHPTIAGKYLQYIKHRINFDILVASMAYPCGYWAMRVRDRLRVPIVIITEAADVQDRPDLGGIYRSQRSRMIISRTLASADAVTALCRLTASYCIEKGANADRLSIIPNGVDYGRIRQTEPRFRKRPYILTISRPYHVKGIDILLRAFEIISKRISELDLLIVGVSCSDINKILSNNVMLNSRVTFAGIVIDEEKYALLKGCKLFILPSRSEALPMSILEAMAAGKPIVATDVGGIPEIVKHNYNGLIIPPEDPEAMAEAVLQLLQSNILLDTMGKHSNEKAQRYVWHELVDKYIEIFEDLVLHR